MMRLALILTLMAPAAVAQPVMSAEEFDRYTLGKTLFYGFDGTAYGVERYLSGRRVIWSFLDGECKEGIWYEAAGQICFVYEDRPDPQCWVFRDTGGGLVAQFEGDPTQTELYEAEEIGEEMLCYGPDVGV
ncbi:hypothetical protein KQ247_15510 [Ruegeria pomeroyi]|uniref:Uncharacterized protein n=2 Tax=Ruegeria pomeroyi TaxID=89184 RepID=Q5LTS1_RUEPO|nr:hypothetical protein [Ruegeria pomeroyi]AAV94630.1 hypothetical protein SPO1342 [Ruegeria pomeroyi DSS-3]NVK98473.1 hypothetical protein [Ruegeria pomeroyi]NVL02204.1 hypothetical protein [Ruegeria pomeroyi]QWV08212.1 hypothetical protein KQ247_15510 [Ruegeria pomeroyi]